MKLVVTKSQGGMTLVDMMVSVACGSIVLAGLLVAGVALQRSFMAVEGYSMSQGDQLRVQDYIALDCRRSVNATVANNTITLSVPQYYNTSTGAAITPVYDITTGVTQYSNGATVPISYYLSGTNFIRQVNGVENVIATNVDTFTVTPQDLTSSVTCSITFAPRFVYLPGPGPVNGTTVFSNTFLRNAVARR